MEATVSLMTIINALFCWLPGSGSRDTFGRELPKGANARRRGSRGAVPELGTILTLHESKGLDGLTLYVPRTLLGL